MGCFGAFFGNGFVQSKLKRLFQYRHRVTKNAMRARGIPNSK